MKTESIPKIENIKNKTENNEITSLKDRIFSLVSDVKEKYPTFEKVIEMPGKIIRLMTVLVALEGGQLFAQEISKDTNTKEPFATGELMDKLNTIALSEIEYRLEPLKLPLPKGEVKFSQTIKNDNRLEGTDYNERSYKGTVPVDTGMVGDVGIYHTTHFIKRNNQITGSNQKNNYDSIEDVLTGEIKVLNNFENANIEKTTSDTIRVRGHGYTKQNAIMDAMKELNMCVGEYISTGTSLNKEGLRQNEVETIETKMTYYVTIDGVNMFKNLHIDKIEEVKEGDFTAFHVYVSAQKGQLKTIE